MKRGLQLLTVILVIMAVFVRVQAQESIYYDGCWGQAGFNVEQQDVSGIQVTFSVPRITVEDVNINGEMMKNIGIEGVFVPANEGTPNLPGTGRFIAIPQGATASVEILSMRTEVIHGINVAPAPRIPKETEDGLEFHKNMEIYGSNSLYPANPVQVSEVTQARGVDVIILGFTPFQYNPVTKDLIVYKDIRVKVHFNGGNGHFGEDRLRSRWFDPILQDMLLNPGMLPKMNYDKARENTEDIGFEYLIIVPNDAIFSQWADSIKAFRTEQGILTGIKTLADIGGNTSTIIENYVNNAYNTWDIPPVACLIIGDYGTNAANTVTSPIWNSYCVSDNIYADVNADQMPDIAFARMTAQNATQLQTMVTKFLNYERNPPTSQDFYAHPISALGWQTERWFQICSEVIGGYWKNVLGKQPVRINAVYSGNPASDPWSTATNTATVLNYFGPSGLNYIPATPQGIGGFSGGTPAQVNTAINAGSFMLQHRDHGMETGWGEPGYENSHIDGLTNLDLCYIMSVNCLTGKYNYSSEVFAEKFHRYKYNGQNSGALGILAASEVSYSFVNDAFIWGVYDNMWPNFMPSYGSTPAERGVLPAFGNSAGKYFLQQSSWPYNTSNKEVTYNLFHHHGDAFMTVYTEVPQSLTVNHAPVIFTGVTSFDVAADSGAFICLSLNGVILGTGVGQGIASPVSINIPGTQLPPDYITVVATKQNYLRYEGQVQVIPPSGPYILKDTYSITDPNGNGQPDYGESIAVNMSMKNVGILPANNVLVTLTTTSTYITLTDATENYGTIPAGGTITINAGFSFDVAVFLPDGTPANFTITATDGTNTWVSYMTLILYAPALQVGNITVNDPLGNNNHRLDPGETADIVVTTKNNGHSGITDVYNFLTSVCPDITFVVSMDTIPSITANGFQNTTFTITVSPTAQIGTVANFNYTANSGPYNTAKVFSLTIGIVSEDWETGNFTKFTWNNTSAVPWTITTINPYEGQYCARSGQIGNNAQTILQLDVNVVSNDSISFYKKVSSEVNYDFLQFYIDNNMLGQWSGNVDWTRAVYAVTAGVHNFKWRYMKDSYQTGGQDAAWIDYIIFPPLTAMPIVVTGSATPSSVCSGATSQLNVNASGGSAPYTYAWSPAASLSNPAIANPVATPATTTTYTVTVTDSQGQTNTQTVTVTVVVAPATPNAPTTANVNVCQGTSATSISVPAVTGATSYGWSVSPSNAGTITGTSANVSISWNASFLGQATITVKAINSCGESVYSAGLVITMNASPSVTQTPFNAVCVNWPASTLTGGNPSGGVYSGPGVTNNMFNPSTVGVGTWQVTYTYTAPSGCANFAVQLMTVSPCTGISDPTAKPSVQVYPNPSEGIINIEVNALEQEKVNLSVMNLLGESVYTEAGLLFSGKTTHSVDLGQLSQGVYFIKLEGRNINLKQKIVLEGK